MAGDAVSADHGPHLQWRFVLDQTREKPPKLDSAEHDVLAFLDLPNATGCRSRRTRWSAWMPG
jgi:hypothetical protein